MRFGRGLLCGWILFGACSDPESPDGGVDAGMISDTGSDSGPRDLGGFPDASPEDSGLADAIPTDADPGDLAGPDDADPADVIEADADQPDGSESDAGEPGDAEPGDLLPADTGPDDAGLPTCGDGLVEGGEVCEPNLDLCCNSTCTGPLAADTPCRAGASCDPEERCDGISPTCPVDLVEPEGASCVGCTGTSSTTCLGCFGGTCQPYVSPCLAILQRGQSTGDGIYTIPTSETGTTAEQVFCDMTTDGGGWTMVYKKSAGVAGNAAALWNTPGAGQNQRALLNRARATSDYSTPLASRLWVAFAEARVEVVTASIAVKALHFDVVGRTPVDWFAPDRVTLSPWTDLPTIPTWQNNSGRFFSIQGTTTRTWYLNSTWGGCPSDTGWLMIAHSNFCYWEGRSPDAPSEIFYSAGTTIASIPNTTQTPRADALIVFLR